jgi:hypothetical protein
VSLQQPTLSIEPNPNWCLALDLINIFNGDWLNNIIERFRNIYGSDSDLNSKMKSKRSEDILNIRISCPSPFVHKVGWHVVGAAHDVEYDFMFSD